jgi:hypothetical protein
MPLEWVTEAYEEGSEKFRTLLLELAKHPNEPRPYAEVEQGLGWRTGTIASLFGGYSNKSKRRWNRRRPFHFGTPDEDTWWIWMDPERAAVVGSSDSDGDGGPTSGVGPDARQFLSEIVGRTVYTLGSHRPNKILQLDGEHVIVSTEKSPTGEPVPVEWVQAALDRLHGGEEVEVSVSSLGHRSAFVGAILGLVPGAVVDRDPTRVTLRDQRDS